MSQNVDTVNAYLDSFRTNDHGKILACLTDDIEWTVFGAFRLSGNGGVRRGGRWGARVHRPAHARGRAHGRAGCCDGFVDVVSRELEDRFIISA